MFQTSYSKACLILLVILGVYSSLVLFSRETRAETVVTSVQVLGICGDGFKDWNEDCDITLGGQSCSGLGYGDGVLSCTASCTFNTSQCATAGVPISPGTGGGGYILPSAVVTLLGRAYPEAILTVLKDGETFITGKKVDYSGDFAIRIFDIREGIYTFGFRAKDTEGRESITFNVTVTTAPATSITIGGIFIPPTIELEKTDLKKGEILKAFGQTGPKSEISISIIDSAGQKIIKKSQAKTDGTWFFSLNAAGLEEGSYTIKAEALSPDGLISSYSQALEFNVEGKLAPEEIPEEIPEKPELACGITDINCDGKVDLVDFSILLYWWAEYHPEYDFNKDKVVDLTDFSIMMYYWTG